eukprot:scaffold1741_cov262-Pinguiococcus_pyrenoidosus.AAC.44
MSSKPKGRHTSIAAPYSSGGIWPPHVEMQRLVARFTRLPRLWLRSALCLRIKAAIEKFRSLPNCASVAMYQRKVSADM